MALLFDLRIIFQISLDFKGLTLLTLIKANKSEHVFSSKKTVYKIIVDSNEACSFKANKFLFCVFVDAKM